MARKSTQKTSKTSKKVAKKTSKVVAKRAPKFASTAKITVVAKENPRREGTVQHARFAVLAKFSGKPVESFLSAKGGDVLALRRAVNEGLVRVA